MVSVFDGQLTRTWLFSCEGKKHTVNLYHDTITGVRSAMLDFEEIPDSIGNSSLLMDSKGHQIFFKIGENTNGYVEIKRHGWTGFAYSCVVNDFLINEMTQLVPSTQDEEIFRTKIEDTLVTLEEGSDQHITWYVVTTTRLRDNVTTTVHRRFKDFADLNSQVKQNLKGHHLRSSIPPFPEKTLKITTDHRVPEFINDRKIKLQNFLVSLLAIPHVADMNCAKSFVGLMDQVKEISFAFHLPKLGISLGPADKRSVISPAVVLSLKTDDVCEGKIFSGDAVSRINGVSVSGMSFNGVVQRISSLPRPLVIHFVQVVTKTSDARPIPAMKVQEVCRGWNGANSTGSPSSTGHSTSKQPLPSFAGDDEVNEESTPQDTYQPPRDYPRFQPQAAATSTITSEESDQFLSSPAYNESPNTFRAPPALPKDLGINNNKPTSQQQQQQQPAPKKIVISKKHNYLFGEEEGDSLHGGGSIVDSVIATVPSKSSAAFSRSSQQQVKEEEPVEEVSGWEL